MGIQLSGKKGSMSEPNVVPLIDVLLVLIIIFMAITPTTPTGMAAVIPQSPSKTAPPASPVATIVVQVAADGGVKINQTGTTWNNLGPQLAEIFKTRADKTAFIKGDDSASFGRIARAVDIMRGAGVVNVGLITAKMETE